ncbi:MAG TPA: STAS domain-containing protein [Xanthomonadaceae bacterium]|nr:STAS domain-containing protein [Xanthomonadaceae bacterium]
MNRCSTETRGAYTVVALAGEVDLSWSQQVRDSILAALKTADHVAADMSAVAYIDSSGIAALVEGFQAARGRGKDFVLLSVSQPALAVLRLARLDKVFRIVATLEEAG